MADTTNSAIIQEIRLLVKQDPQTQPEIQKLVTKLTAIVQELEKSGLSAGKFSKMLSDWTGKLNVFETKLKQTKQYYEQWAKEIDAAIKKEATARKLVSNQQKQSLDEIRAKEISNITAKNNGLQELNSYYKQLEKKSDIMLEKQRQATIEDNKRTAQAKQRIADAHQEANLMNKQINKQKTLNDRTARHAKIRKTLGNTLHKNANTMDRMQHNQTVLSNRLKTSVVGSTKYKKIQQQTLEVEKKISAAKATQKQSFGQIFKSAFSLNKMLNRMAFVTTAMISYKMLEIGKNMVSGVITNTIKWEEEMSKVYSLLDKTEDKFRGLMDENVLKLMVKYGQTLEESVRAVYDTLSARFDPRDVGIITEASATLAIAEFTDIRTATDLLTTTLNSFNLKASDSDRIINLLSQTITDAKSTIQEMGPNFGKIAASASALNLSLEDTVALFSLLTIKGIKTDVAITAIRQLMFTLAAPTGKAKKAMDEYGVNLSLARIKAEGFKVILEELKGADEEFLFTLVKTRRGAQALLPMLNSGAMFMEILKNQTDGTTAAFDKFEERSEITKIAIDKLKNSFFLLGQSIGEDFNEPIREGAESLTAFNIAAANFKDTGFGAALLKILGTIISITAFVGTLGLFQWLFKTAPLVSAGKAIASVSIKLFKLIKLLYSVPIALGKWYLPANFFANFAKGIVKLGGHLVKLNGHLVKFSKTILSIPALIAAMWAIPVSGDIPEFGYLEMLDEMDKKNIEREKERTANTVKQMRAFDEQRKKQIEYYTSTLWFYDQLTDQEKALYSLKIRNENTEARILELQKKRNEENKFNAITTAKEELELAQKIYDRQQALATSEFNRNKNIETFNKIQTSNINNLIKYEEDYIAVVAKGSIAQIEAQTRLNNLIAKKNSLLLFVGPPERDYTPVDLTQQMDVDEFAKIQNDLYRTISDGGDIATGKILELYNTTNMSQEQMIILMKLIKKLLGEVDSSGEEEGLNWKNILGVPDFETEADALAYAEQQLADSIMAIGDQILQHQLDAIETRKERDLEALAERYDAYRDHVSGTILTEGHKAKVMEALAKKEAEKKAEIEKKAAEAMAKQQKRNAQYSAGLDYARGVVGILATEFGSKGILGIPTAEFLQGMLLTAFLAQMAIISGTKYATGGISDGPSHTQGGIQMYHKSGAHMGEMEGHEMIHSKKATTGNEDYLLAQNSALSKGVSPTDFATRYLSNSLEKYVSPAPRLSYAVGGISQTTPSSSGLSTAVLQGTIDKQSEILDKNLEVLEDIAESNRGTKDNTKKISKKGGRY